MEDEWKEKLIDAILEGNNNRANSIKSKYVPRKLYKYCPLDEFCEINIRDNTIWLSYPEKVNDPYDTSVTINGKRLANNSFQNGDFWKTLENRGMISSFTEEEKNHINLSEDCEEAFIAILIKKYPNNKDSIMSFIRSSSNQKHREALERFNNFQKTQLDFVRLVNGQIHY